MLSSALALALLGAVPASSSSLWVSSRSGQAPESGLAMASPGHRGPMAKGLSLQGGAAHLSPERIFPFSWSQVPGLLGQ